MSLVPVAKDIQIIFLIKTFRKTKILIKYILSRNHINLIIISSNVIFKSFHWKRNIFLFLVFFIFFRSYFPLDRYNNPECPKCEKRFSRPHVLERHLMTQHNIYHCPECSKTFLKKSVYNEHMKIHSDNITFCVSKHYFLHLQMFS